MRYLPDLRNSFKTDLATNLKKLSNDFTITLHLHDIEKACYIYAADMCLEFKRKFGGDLPGVNDEIIDQVADVFTELFPQYFNSASRERCRIETKNLVNTLHPQETIDAYYAQINRRYSGL
jgi:hypothetical protein